MGAGEVTRNLASAVPSFASHVNSSVRRVSEQWQHTKYYTLLCIEGLQPVLRRRSFVYSPVTLGALSEVRRRGKAGVAKAEGRSL
jgi:hypothetical protein